MDTSGSAFARAAKPRTVTPGAGAEAGPRRRIALVIESTGAGIGRHVVDLAAGLADMGHDVHVLYSSRRMDNAFRAGMARVTGATWTEVALRREPHPSDVVSIAGVRAYLRRHGPFDVVHGHSSKGGAVARLASVGLPGIRVYTPNAFVTMDPLLTGGRRRALAAAERLLGRLAHGVIVVSVEEYDHAVALGIPRAKLVLIPNGLGPAPVEGREAVRRRLGLADDELCVGFVGRLVPQKAPEVLLRAFGSLTGEFANVRLVVVGEGPLREPLRQEASRLGIEGRVLWLGEADGRSLMPAFDVFTLPSRYEGFAYVLLEALAARLPIVATAVGGVSAVVASGQNGFVVAVDDVGALAAALRAVLGDERLRAAMGRSSGARSRHFGVDRMVRETVRFYERLLAERDDGEGR